MWAVFIRHVGEAFGDIHKFLVQRKQIWMYSLSGLYQGCMKINVFCQVRALVVNCIYISGIDLENRTVLTDFRWCLHQNQGNISWFSRVGGFMLNSARQMIKCHIVFGISMRNDQIPLKSHQKGWDFSIFSINAGFLLHASRERQSTSIITIYLMPSSIKHMTIKRTPLLAQFSVKCESIFQRITGNTGKTR